MNQEQKISNAQAMVKKWTRKLSLASTKLRYYTRQLERLQKPKPAAKPKIKADKRAFDFTT